MLAFAADPINSTDVPFSVQDGNRLEGVIPDIKKQLVVAQIKYSELSSVYKPDVPEIIRLEAERLTNVFEREQVGPVTIE